MDHCGSPGTGTWYPPSVTGVGLGLDGPGALGVPGGLGDRAGRRVVGAGSAELRPSVVAARVVPARALTETQKPRSTSKMGGRPRGPIARPNPARPATVTPCCRATAAARHRALPKRAARPRETEEAGAGPGPGGGAWAGRGGAVSERTTRDWDQRQCETNGDGGRGGVCILPLVPRTVAALV